MRLPFRRSSLARAVAGAAAAGALLWPALAPAAGLDPTFGHGGLVLVSFGEHGGAAGDIEATRDGRLVAAGLAGDGFALVRLTASGRLDPSFGAGGRARTPGFGSIAVSRAYPALALGPDGSAVVAGGTEVQNGGRRIALARFDADGALDRGFGGDGKVVLSIRTGVSEQARDVALQPDGKIIVVGDSGDSMMVVRLHPDGTPDAGFGTGGSVLLRGHPDSPSSVATAVLVQPDGSMVVAGGTLVPATAYDIAVVRLRPDGTLDPSFGSAGRAIVPIGPGGAVDGIASQGLAPAPDGGLIAAGYALDPDLRGGDVGLLGLTAGGLPDARLGGDGTLTLGLGAGVDRAAGVVVAGSTLYLATDAAPPAGVGSRRLAVVALRADGARDTGFAPGGVLEIPLGDPSGARDAAGLALRPDGRIALLARLIGGEHRAGAFGIALVDPGPTAAAPRPGGDAGPRSRIAPIPEVVRRRRLRRVRGTAEAAAGLARVEIALVRRIGARRRCALLRRDGVHFRIVRSAGGRCTRRIWIRAAGNRAWRLRLRRPLPAGRYLLFSRAIDATGRTETAFGRARGNRVAFRVR